MTMVRRVNQSLQLILGIILTGLLCVVYTQEKSQKRLPLLMPNVRPEKDETYLCAPFEVNSDTINYITAFEPNATMNTVHHMLLFGCTKPGTTDKVYNCGGVGKQSGISTAPVCSDGLQIIYAWAKNAPKLVLPEGVGFEIGGNSSVKYLVLQIHYPSAEPFKDGSDDNTGVTLIVTTDPQPKNAGILLIETGGKILPNSVENMEEACNITEDKVIHPFAFRTHTHSLGRAVSGYRITPEGDNMTWTLIGTKDPQLPQMFYPVTNNITISKGDMVAVRCMMESTRGHVTRIGSTKEDEMCNFYIMYWTDGPLLTQKICSPGNDSDETNIPNEE